MNLTPTVGRRQQAAGGTADVCGACGTNYADAWHHQAEEAYEVSVSEWSDYNQLNKMKYIIIGLGNYGHVLAEELSALGHEVIGADVSAGRVDSLKEKIATAFVIDATDEQALSVLPLNSVDVVIVCHRREFSVHPSV